MNDVHIQPEPTISAPLPPPTVPFRSLSRGLKEPFSYPRLVECRAAGSGQNIEVAAIGTQQAAREAVGEWEEPLTRNPSPEKLAAWNFRRRHLSPRILADESGMSTIEYVMGALAAAALAGVLYTVVTGKGVLNALQQIIMDALSNAPG